MRLKGYWNNSGNGIWNNDKVDKIFSVDPGDVGNNERIGSKPESNLSSLFFDG